MNDPYIIFEKVKKSYGMLTVVKDLDMSIDKGEFISLLGPSGSGKTTLLMMLAGFERVSGGHIRVNGKQIDNIAAHKRNMGVVFQNYALFPHMSVGQNIAFPLKMRGVSKSEITERVKKSLDMVQLLSMIDRRPGQLSGGQQQRVALARALVFEPEVVLMDEPLGALDKKLREQMQIDIRRLHRELGLTIVFVTHDQGEALTMSDRIAVFNQGRIEQIASPNQIYDHPSTKFVADFIGESNLLDGRVIQNTGDHTKIEVSKDCILTVAGRYSFADKQSVSLCIRPERVRLEKSTNIENAIAAKVEDVVYHGNHLQIIAQAGPFPFMATTDRLSKVPKIGDELIFYFSAADSWIVV